MQQPSPEPPEPLAAQQPLLGARLDPYTGTLTDLYIIHLPKGQPGEEYSGLLHRRWLMLARPK